MSKKLPPADAFFLLTESDNTPNQIGVLCRFKLPKGKTNKFILDLVNEFSEYQPTAAPWNLKLAGGVGSKLAPAWEPAAYVEMDYHLRHAALPQPGGERELAVLISRIHSIPLDHNRPMWECHVIEGLADGTFAVYMKMHHALVDGVAGSRIISRWMSPDPKATHKPVWMMKKPSSGKRPDQAAQARATLAKQLTKPAKSMATVLGAVRESVRGSRSKVKGLVAPYSAPTSIFNRAVGPQRRVSTVDLDIDRLLAIGKAMGGTLNDVVMAISGGAVRSYLLEQNALPNKPLTAQVPVSLKTKDDQGGGNALGMILASMATHEADPADRFATVRQSMKAGKALMSEMSVAEVTAYASMMMLPYTIGQMTGIGNRAAKPAYSMVISNVPGPKEVRYVNGAECISMHPVSFIMQGQALNITLFTYADKLSFIFTACSQSLPNVQKLVPHTIAAMEELEAAAGIKAPKKKSPAAPRKKAAARKVTAKTNAEK